MIGRKISMSILDPATDETPPRTSGNGGSHLDFEWLSWLKSLADHNGKVSTAISREELRLSLVEQSLLARASALVDEALEVKIRREALAARRVMR